MFSLYCLSYWPTQLDSAIDLYSSQLRNQTSHVASILADWPDVSHESLQRAMLNLSKLFSDTLSLSLRAGGSVPCLLPLRARLSEFTQNSSNTCRSSSSVVDSLQSSLIGPPDLDITPIRRTDLPEHPEVPVPAEYRNPQPCPRPHVGEQLGHSVSDEFSLFLRPQSPGTETMRTERLPAWDLNPNSVEEGQWPCP